MGGEYCDRCGVELSELEAMEIDPKHWAEIGCDSKCLLLEENNQD